MHEILLSEDEARNATQFKECFIVQPNNNPSPSGSTNRLFGLMHSGNGNGQPCPEGFRYTSDNNTQWLRVEDLRELVEKTADDYSIEKSRWSMEDVPGAQV